MTPLRRFCSRRRLRIIASTPRRRPKKKRRPTTIFNELGSQKNEPAENADLYQSRPWRLAIEGECAKPGVFELDDLLALAPLEESDLPLAFASRRGRW